MATSFVDVFLIPRPSFLFSQKSVGHLPHVSDSTRVMAVALVLLGACGTSTAYTILRWLRDQINTLIPVTYFTGFDTIGSIICLVTFPSLPDFILPTGAYEWTITIGLGIGAFLVRWALTRGMQLTKCLIGS
jgi:hypothetical protein